MGSLSEITSDFEIDILFTQLWRDESLSFLHMLACKRNITLESRMLQKIWTLNTCLINSKRTMIHASPSENVMIILYELRSPSPAANVGCIARFHPEAVDKFSIVAFPLAFTMFNLVYWWRYLSQTFDYKVSQVTQSSH